MNGKIGYCAVLVLLLLISCRKEEIQVEPIGDEVPWQGPTQSLAQVLDSSGNLTLFKAAWKRSHMESLLLDKGIQQYTLFVPTDAAMGAAGWDLTTINNTSAEELDSLLCFHTAAVPVQPELLEQTIGNLKISTLLQSNWELFPGYFYRFTYSFYLGLHNNDLLVNGKPANTGLASKVATNGVLYRINEVLIPPAKDVYYTLLEDDRFSFYLEACRISDSMYLNKFDFAFEPYQNIRRLTLDGQLNGSPASGGTLIIPTNTAFQRAGFNSIAGIRQYIESAPLPDPDYSGPEPIVAMTNMDSLLKPCQILGATGQYGQFESVFFSNDMTDNKGLTGLVLNQNLSGSTAGLKYVEIEFFPQKPVIKVRRRGSRQQPTELVAQDIRALNGVIHAVDDILLPL